MSRPYGTPKTERERLETHQAMYGSSNLPQRGAEINNPHNSELQPVKANRDYPYHDFVTFDDGDEPIEYPVGKNNKDAFGDQKKLFVSKSTMVLSDVECIIRFNNTENTPITIRADTQYEFFSNISSVYVSAIGAQGHIDIGFEGVLPQETRDAE